MNNSFKSKIGPLLSSYLAFKRSLKYKLVSVEALVVDLDNYICSNYPEATTLTQEIVYGWGFPKDSNALPQTINKRLALLTNLGKFLSISNPDTFILSKKERLSEEKSFISRVLTKEEVENLFYEADRYESDGRYAGLTLSVVLRLMYTTGMRPGEVLRLGLNDYNPDTGEIFIKESKSLKSRRIIISQEMANLMDKYLEITCNAVSDRDKFLFTIDGNRSEIINSSWLNSKVKTLSKLAMLNPPFPRPYDFRHTFITTRILQWINEGKDINIMIPFLRIYVGHDSVNDTWYYFKLIPQHSNLISNITTLRNAVIPDIKDNDYEK